MDEIFKQYGGAILTVVAIVALCALVAIFFGQDGGPVKEALSSLVSSFADKAGL